jgi:hypothetical protein
MSLNSSLVSAMLPNARCAASFASIGDAPASSLELLFSLQCKMDVELAIDVVILGLSPAPETGAILHCFRVR